MSQTKAQLLNPTGVFTLTDQLVGVGATFSGNVSIAGTLTKQDVTNVDSIGVITARNRIDMTQGYQLGWKSGSTERARIHGDSGSNFIIETGATPTERVRVTSSGRVGIGSNSPKTSLDVAGLVNLVNGSPEVHFTTGAAHYNWRVAAQEVVDEGFEIASGTQSADGVNDTYTTRLTIKADGKLGIGTVSPSAYLDVESNASSGYTAEFRSVHASNSARILIDSPADNNIRPSSIVLANAGTDKWGIGQVYGSSSSGAFHICAGSASEANSKLTITTSGLVGIATAAPADAWLDIASSAGTESIRMRRLSSDVNVASNWALKPYGKNLYFREGASSPYDRVHFTDTGNVVATGTVSDSKGDLRKIVKSTKSSAYVLVASDAGKAIYTDSGVTLNNNIFGNGDAVSIINQSSSDITITQGSGVTIYNTADAATGNRTLSGRGMATMWFADPSTAYISGSVLS